MSLEVNRRLFLLLLLIRFEAIILAQTHGDPKRWGLRTLCSPKTKGLDEKGLSFWLFFKRLRERRRAEVTHLAWRRGLCQAFRSNLPHFIAYNLLKLSKWNQVSDKRNLYKFEAPSANSFKIKKRPLNRSTYTAIKRVVRCLFSSCEDQQSF